VAKLVGGETRDDAESLSKFSDISIKHNKLPQKKKKKKKKKKNLAGDDFYWRELVGCKLVTEKGGGY